MLKKLENKFKEVFKTAHEHVVFSPGRINIIGEHIDYNGGNVFPASISFGTYVLFSRRADDKVCLYSENFWEQGVFEGQIGSYVKQGNKWTNYALGMLATFEKHGFELDKGFNAYVWGNIPNGAGLSSSASVEMAFGVLIDFLGNFQIEMKDIVGFAQEAESDFVGVAVGIMDMFAIGMGKKDQAILLNTESLMYEYYPLQLGAYDFVIMNTNKRRELADSKYNERRSECEKALALLKPSYEIQSLCELTIGELEHIKIALNDDVLYRRVEHVVTEQYRTESAKNAMLDNDLAYLGELLNASHESLEKNYEVTGKELDAITHFARTHHDVLGARMTGAGFGGCAIALVKKEGIEAFKKDVSLQYEAEIGHVPTFYQVSIANGTKVLA